MKHILLILSFILIFTPILHAADEEGEFKSSQQITKDLMVTGTRGISIKPHGNRVEQVETSYVTSGEDSSQKPERGRVDLYIQFEYAKSSLTAQSREQLKELAIAMNDSALVDDVFLIAGHTDAVGSDSYNMGLSEKRAKAVVEYLSQQLGISGERLISRGFGERLLKDKSSPGSGVNRRVEVVNIRALQ